MKQIKINNNSFEYIETTEDKEKKLKEQDNELIMSELILENALLKQRLTDMELIIADLLGGATQ